MMNPRIDPQQVIPDAMKALGQVHAYLQQTALPRLLIDLVFLRVSQINGCAYCIDMHARDLLKQGLGIDKLVLVPTWQEGGALFDARERAALAWAEQLTLVAQTQVPDEAFNAARAVFSEKELADLTIVVALMNAYNRVGVSLRLVPAAARGS